MPHFLCFVACFFQSLFSQPTPVVDTTPDAFDERVLPRVTKLVLKLEELYKSERANQLLSDEGPVTEKEMALQAADLAKSECPENKELIVSALLHHVGHLLCKDKTAEGHLENKEGFNFLQPIWGDKVARPILHSIEAKRFLAAIDAGYICRLSEKKQKSFLYQGGAFSPDSSEYAAFRKLPDVESILAIRRWNDCATVCGKKTSSFESYRAVLIETAYQHLKEQHAADQIPELIALLESAIFKLNQAEKSCD
jgi:predicted HD phosphohydrolase